MSANFNTDTGEHTNIADAKRYHQICVCTSLMLVFHFLGRLLSRTGLRAVRDNNFLKNQCHVYGLVGVVVVVLGVIVASVVTIVVFVVGIAVVVSGNVDTLLSSQLKLPTV